jgi:P-type E1-E2 ATPase
VVINEQLVGLISLADTLRTDAADIVRDLKTAGIKRIVLISGDNNAAVESVAKRLGIDEHHAQVLPQQKLDIIKQLQSEGHRVAYVGDGVNDAPALAVADVGIAMGAAGTDIAIETANIALMTDDIKNLPHLIALARETLRTVRANVAFSMSMNILALFLSMFGIIGPAFGAMMHELSALPVLAYSARLVSFRRRDKSST